MAEKLEKGDTVRLKSGSQRLRDIEFDMRHKLVNNGTRADTLAADYLQLLIRANNNDEIDDDQFFNGLDLLHRYLLSELPR